MPFVLAWNTVSVLIAATAAMAVVAVGVNVYVLLRKFFPFLIPTLVLQLRNYGRLLKLLFSFPKKKVVIREFYSSAITNKIIVYNEAFALEWQVENAWSVTIAPDPGQVTTSGRIVQVADFEKREFVLTAKGWFSTVSKSITICPPKVVFEPVKIVQPTFCTSYPLLPDPKKLHTLDTTARRLEFELNYEIPDYANVINFGASLNPICRLEKLDVTVALEDKSTDNFYYSHTKEVINKLDDLANDITSEISNTIKTHYNE
ncbi:MAG: hypothetical protein KIS94_05070 [Chitinophagales bacterium]|nr:hypothetical protein [Chitinophagales bacterium]